MTLSPIRFCAVSTVAFGLLAATAMAGDKIEFSAPSPSMALPGQEPESSKISDKFQVKFSEGNVDQGLQFTPPPATYVLVGPSRNSRPGELSLSRQDRDSGSDRFSRQDASANGATNGWNSSTGLKPFSSDDELTRRNDDLSNDSLSSNPRDRFGYNSGRNEVETFRNSSLARAYGQGEAAILDQMREQNSSRLEPSSQLLESTSPLSKSADPLRGEQWQSPVDHPSELGLPHSEQADSSSLFGRSYYGDHSSAGYNNNYSPGNSARQDSLSPVTARFQQHMGVLQFPKRDGLSR